MQVVSRNGWKKKLMEENEYEERQKREEHYQRMEELLEKMSKEKETEWALIIVIAALLDAFL